MSNHLKEWHFIIAMGIAGGVLATVVGLYVGIAFELIHGINPDIVEKWVDNIVTVSIAFILGIYIGKNVSPPKE